MSGKYLIISECSSINPNTFPPMSIPDRFELGPCHMCICCSCCCTQNQRHQLSSIGHKDLATAHHLAFTIQHGFGVRLLVRRLNVKGSGPSHLGHTHHTLEHL